MGDRVRTVLVCVSLGGTEGRACQRERSNKRQKVKGEE